MNNDLISRQDAIDALEKQLDYLRMLNKNENPTAEGKWYGVNWARNTIADLPSAERPKFILKVKNLTAEDKKRFQEEWNKSAGGLLAIPDNYEIIPIERPQGELAEKLKDRIEERVCKYCQMNKHCELCEISRVFQIITLTAEEQKGEET